MKTREIYNLIYATGLVGKRSSASECIVSVYINSLIDNEVWFATTNCDCITLFKKVAYTKPEQYKTSPELKAFIRNFDNRMYPKLMVKSEFIKLTV